MDKLNLMKAVLTLYLSAVAAVFFFRPTVKEHIPAKREGQSVCMLSRPVRNEKVLNQFFHVGNTNYRLRPSEEACLSMAEEVPTDVLEGSVLLVREGRSLWQTLTTKIHKK